MKDISLTHPQISQVMVKPSSGDPVPGHFSLWTLIFSDEKLDEKNKSGCTLVSSELRSLMSHLSNDLSISACLLCYDASMKLHLKQRFRRSKHLESTGNVSLVVLQGPADSV